MADFSFCAILYLPQIWSAYLTDMNDKVLYSWAFRQFLDIKASDGCASYSFNEVLTHNLLKI